MYNVMVWVCTWMMYHGGIKLGTISKLLTIGQAMDYMLFIILMVEIVTIIVAAIDIVNLKSDDAEPDELSGITKIVFKVIG